MSAKAADLHSYRVVGFWQSTNGKKSRSAMGNPDCGLKTRGWAEVRLALGNMVATPAILRASIASRRGTDRVVDLRSHRMPV
jgi:hypothetical protein